MFFIHDELDSIRKQKVHNVKTNPKSEQPWLLVASADPFDQLNNWQGNAQKTKTKQAVKTDDDRKQKKQNEKFDK